MKLCIAGKNNIAIDILKYSLNFFEKTDVFIIVNETDKGVIPFKCLY